MRSAKREFEGAEEELSIATKERKELIERFDKDLTRFKELKGIKE